MRTKRLPEQRIGSLGEAMETPGPTKPEFPPRFKERNGFALFDVPDDAAQFGPEDVERAMNEEIADFAKYFRDR